MPTMSDIRSVAANTTVENIIQGKLHEFLTEASAIAVFMTSSGAGLFASVLVGGEAFVQDQEVSDANRFPRTNEDLLSAAGGFQSDRIVISLRNSTAGALTARTLVDLTPV